MGREEVRVPTGIPRHAGVPKNNVRRPKTTVKVEASPALDVGVRRRWGFTPAIRDHVERVVEVRDMVLDNLAERYLAPRVRLEQTAPSFQRLPFHSVQAAFGAFFPVDTAKGKYHFTEWGAVAPRSWTGREAF